MAGESPALIARRVSTFSFIQGLGGGAAIVALLDLYVHGASLFSGAVLMLAAVLILPAFIAESHYKEGIGLEQ